MTEPHNRQRPTALMVGQPFNPNRLFTGIFIPEALVRSKLVSPGAKMAYGRLARYAGEDGRCFPAVSNLALEIGIGVRQAQKYLAELEKAKLLEPGDLVLDIFAGSNTTGQVAEATKQRWLAFKLSREYVGTSVFRFLSKQSTGAQMRKILHRIEAGETVDLNEGVIQSDLLPDCAARSRPTECIRCTTPAILEAQ